MLKLWLFLCSLFVLIGVFKASGKVVLIGNDVTFSFDSSEANFAPSVKGSGIIGTLYIAEPLDGCAPLTNKIVRKSNDTNSAFVLMIRGECGFEDKVRRAQVVGFNASIVYDNQDDSKLISMAGNSAGISIPAVFVSKSSGETLAKYVGDDDIEIYILPSFEFSAWAIMAISFISLLALSAVLATCFFVRRHRIRRERPRAPRVREFHGMSGRLVTAMPSLVFTTVLEDNTTSRACAICLDDYNVGDKLRVLPCRHKFHALCVDAWLTSWRTFCPICKRDARTDTGEPPASESTPLLSSSMSGTDSALSSFRSSVASSSAIQIARSSSRPQSISSTPYNYSLRSHAHSPHLSASRSSVDIRNMSSQRSNGAYLVSPHSYGYPSLSSLNSRYLSPYIPSPGNYIPSPGNGSSSYIGSSRRANALHYSESAASFSPFTSAQSLPEC